MSKKYKTIEISLTKEYYEGWIKYCKYNEKTQEQIIQEIVAKWVNEEYLQLQELDNELNGAYPSERLEHM